ncbi:MAG TPA: hypothetical protein VHY79_13985 [Rhizomicrobium sp.]|jgi:hypothetical protein|nr:hypothetical protein [Rhizomicrobium sp.]
MSDDPLAPERAARVAREGRVARAAMLANLPIRKESLPGVTRKISRDWGDPDNLDSVTDDQIIASLHDVRSDTPTEFGAAPQPAQKTKAGLSAADRLEAANEESESYRQVNMPPKGRIDLTEKERARMRGWTIAQRIDFANRKAAGEE